MSTKFQTLCSNPRSIRMSGFEDMSDYVTEFKNTSYSVLLFGTPCIYRRVWPPAHSYNILHQSFIF